MESLKGSFLVASPHLPDPNFYRSVVLLIHHDSEGAFGVILNRPTVKLVRDIWEMLGEEPCECEAPIYLGGPVPGPVLAVHSDVVWSESEILPSVYLATEKEYLHRLVRSDDAKWRLFTGYSGWGAGQLETELEVGGWLTAPATSEMIFSDPEELWKTLACRIGLDILAPSIKANVVPQDPSLN